MSYLLGGGDNYKSHQFKNLRWGDMDRYVGKHVSTENRSDTSACSEPTNINMTVSNNQMYEGLELTDDESEFEVDRLQSTEEITLHVDDNSLTTTDALADYMYRPREHVFEDMNIWEYTEHARKITAKSEELKLAALPNIEAAHKRGRHPLPRGKFSSEKHPQFETHLTRIGDILFVPVLLGPTLPRPDRGKDEYEMWCRAMLIIFKPWRENHQLLDNELCWSSAFRKFKFSQSAMEVMANLNIENECQDARDEYHHQRQSG